MGEALAREQSEILDSLIRAVRASVFLQPNNGK